MTDKPTVTREEFGEWEFRAWLQDIGVDWWLGHRRIEGDDYIAAAERVAAALNTHLPWQPAPAPSGEDEWDAAQCVKWIGARVTVDAYGWHGACRGEPTRFVGDCAAVEAVVRAAVTATPLSDDEARRAVRDVCEARDLPLPWEEPAQEDPEGRPLERLGAVLFTEFSQTYRVGEGFINWAIRLLSPQPVKYAVLAACGDGEADPEPAPEIAWGDLRMGREAITAALCGTGYTRPGPNLMEKAAALLDMLAGDVRAIEKRAMEAKGAEVKAIARAEKAERERDQARLQEEQAETQVAALTDRALPEGTTPEEVREAAAFLKIRRAGNWPREWPDGHVSLASTWSAPGGMASVLEMLVAEVALEPAPPAPAQETVFDYPARVIERGRRGCAHQVFPAMRLCARRNNPDKCPHLPPASMCPHWWPADETPEERSDRLLAEAREGESDEEWGAHADRQVTLVWLHGLAETFLNEERIGEFDTRAAAIEAARRAALLREDGGKDE